MTREWLPAWVFMWVLAFALFLGCKWVTWRRANRRGVNPGIIRSLGYFFAWPGMDAFEFICPAVLRDQEHRDTNLVRSGIRHSGFGLPLAFGFRISDFHFPFAVAKTLLGVFLFRLAASNTFRAGPLVTGWLGMLGIVLFLHFGVFDVLALAWRRVGVAVEPVMRAPLFASSLADFWSRRWNTAFNTLAHDLAFRPLARRWGAIAATMGVFLISGLVHEAVISIPARGGFGLPTAYFVLQGVGVLAEKSAWGHRLRLGRGLPGWLFTLVFTAAPAYWLFHPVFIKNVILPMLYALGAT